MSNKRQEIIENYEQHLIGLDDVFAFKCRNCGQCCKNREDLMLNSRDIFNLAKAVSLTNEQAIEKYCETYVGKDSRIPILRLLPVGASKACPLFINNRCSIHALKPTVCALYPLGRAMAFKSDEEGEAKDASESQSNEVKYVLSTSSCGSLKKKQTVREWLAEFNIPVDDIFYLKWNQTLMSLRAAVKGLEGKPGVTDKVLEMLWGGMYMALYVKYDTKKEFYPQFEANISAIQTLLSELQMMMKASEAFFKKR